MNELETRIYNRLKAGMTQTDIRKELGISAKKIYAVYIKHGFDKKEKRTVQGKFPQELIEQWDILHERYGKIPRQLLAEWDAVTRRMRICQK